MPPPPPALPPPPTLASPPQAPGFKLLVATSAAEEGLDVQRCRFVVRYSPAFTGTQRVQSRGRSRMVASEFLTLLQEGEGLCEVVLNKNSKIAEGNMKALMKSF